MTSHRWLRNDRGEWYVVVQAALMLAIAVAPALNAHAIVRGAPWVHVARASGIALCAAGLGSAVLGAAALGRNLSPFPRPKDSGELVDRGVYSVVRHPIYTGILAAAVGWSLAWNSVAALVATMMLLVLFDVKARREERWLTARFGGYAAYRARVKKLIPFLY